MIISSWNVNSVRARIENIKSYLLKYKPDVLMMQEIKTEDVNFPYDDFSAMDYESHVFGQKSYNGVAIISKAKLKNIRTDLIKDKLKQSRIISAEVENRLLVDTEYSKPPLVEVVQGAGGGAPNAAVITPVLVRNAVTTYTPQNAKSFFCRYGSGNSNVFTSDIEVNKEKFAEVVSVTDFTFSGERGRKFIECNGFGGDASRFLQQGDLVQFTTTSDTILRCVVQQATRPAGVLRSRIYFDRSLPEAVSNATKKQLLLKCYLTLE